MYIVSERKTGTKKLSLLSFVKEGTTIKASLNGRGYLRAKTVTTTNSKLVFDVDDNGAAVYSFEFEKDASGRIKLKSYDYAAESGGLSYAVLAKKNEGLAYENSTLNTGNILFKLNGNTIEWDLQNRRTGTIVVGGQPIPVFGIAPEFTLPTYSLSGLGFKSNNDQFLGISVPNWKATTTPVLLLEKDGVVMESVGDSGYFFRFCPPRK